MATQYSTLGADAVPALHSAMGIWSPMFHQECSFGPEAFEEVMMNLIHNPNINSNHLFRADILLEGTLEQLEGAKSVQEYRIVRLDGYQLQKVLVRRLIPRNVLVDKPMDQTCLLYAALNTSSSLVIYLPHVSEASQMPFYHPQVVGIAFLYQQDCTSKRVSIHYCLFPSVSRTEALDRTAQHLLATLHKHGQGTVHGYKKRVHHDVVLPQAKVQDTYARLKTKYARDIISRWVEATDPTKHVFEDLGIAAFLIELWAEMYPQREHFPGFVDIGCGNGLLVHILLGEGYAGWGFDARRRKSWAMYSARAQQNLKVLVLVPEIILQASTDERNRELPHETGVHNGVFPTGTFIISNHADELTPWTPILANISQSPFLSIPCCSHNLTGARFRAPVPVDSNLSNSAYSSLVVWVRRLAEECGWKVEVEMLRIPSTRNTALLGRNRSTPFATVEIGSLIEKYGGCAGWETNALKLVKNGPRGH